jgi:ATP-binding cassette subfamily B protein
MSENKQQKPAGRGPMGGPMGGGPPMGRAVEKAKDFKGTIRRLMKYLLPRKII